MSKHSSQYLSNLKDDAAERLADRLAQLRVLIIQKRAAAKREGRISDTPALRRKHWEELAADYKPFEDIRKRIEEMLTSEEDLKNELMLDLGEEFLKVAELGNMNAIQTFIEEGFPINWQNPENGLTALHIVAACQARNALRVLLAASECDFLLRDNKGRLPSEMAYLYGGDIAVSRLLGNKEKHQADKEQVKITRRPIL